MLYVETECIGGNYDSIWIHTLVSDASFNSGTGINDSAIITRHIAAHNVSNITYVYNETVASAGQSIGAGWTTVTNWTANSFTTTGGDVILHLSWSFYKSSVAGIAQFRLQLNGSANYPSSQGFQIYVSDLNIEKWAAKTIYISGLPASTYSVAFQALSQAGTINVNTNDFMTLIAAEYLR